MMAINDRITFTLQCYSDADLAMLMAPAGNFQVDYEYIASIRAKLSKKLRSKKMCSNTECRCIKEEIESIVALLQNS